MPNEHKIIKNLLTNMLNGYIIKTERNTEDSRYENCGRKSYWEEKEQIDKLIRNMETQFNYIIITINGYEYEEIQRGCTYPKELIFYTEDGRGTEIKRISLIK